jgi:hypothetical protein
VINTLTGIHQFVLFLHCSYSISGIRAFMVEEERKKKYIGRDFLKNLVKKKYSHSGKSSQ